MPRVVPSQVVALIEHLFPLAASLERNHQTQLRLSKRNRKEGQLAAIVNMVDQIPPELITLNARDYSALVVGITEIKRALEKWQSIDYNLREINEFDNLNPLTLIHQTLSTCPDEFPSPATTELHFISDPQLRDNLCIDISATNSALANGEWKAATVLAGSVIEALLLWALRNHSSTTAINSAIKNLTQKVDPSTGKPILGRKPKSAPELEHQTWRLHEYTEVSAELQLIRPNTASLVRHAKDFRNLIHPGAVIRIGYPCNRGTAMIVAGTLEFVIEDLTTLVP